MPESFLHHREPLKTSPTSSPWGPPSPCRRNFPPWAFAGIASSPIDNRPPQFPSPSGLKRHSFILCASPLFTKIHQNSRSSPKNFRGEGRLARESPAGSCSRGVHPPAHTLVHTTKPASFLRVHTVHADFFRPRTAPRSATAEINPMGLCPTQSSSSPLPTFSPHPGTIP
jgi:hypothetical protein